MIKKTVILILSVLCCLTCVFADTTQWEYMVVTFGKTSFSDYNQHVLAYYDEGILSDTMEANVLEYNLNILGRHGWELIAITGTIGGDQQLTLKRPYDEAVSKAEKDRARQVQERIEEELREQREEQQIDFSAPKELMELDSYEAREKENRKKDEIKEGLKAAIHTSLAQSELKILKEEYIYEPNFPAEISLEVLLPKRFLVNGNSYRQSEIKEYKKEIAPYFKLKELELEDSTMVSVIYFLEVDGSYQEADGDFFFYSYHDNAGTWY